MMAQNMNLEQLSEYFHMPINDVAKELGVCATVLKKICRRNGIPRWPHRKIKSIDKRVVTLETTLPKTAEEDQRIKQEVSALKEKKQFLMKNPGILAVKSSKKSSKLIGVSKRNTNANISVSEEESEKEESLRNAIPAGTLNTNPTSTLLSSIYPSFSQQLDHVEDTTVFNNVPAYNTMNPNYNLGFNHDNISSNFLRLPAIKEQDTKKDNDHAELKVCPKFLEPDWGNSCNTRLPPKRPPLQFNINYPFSNTFSNATSLPTLTPLTSLATPLPPISSSNIPVLFANWTPRTSLPDIKLRDRETNRATEAAEVVASLAGFSTEKQNLNINNININSTKY